MVFSVESMEIMTDNQNKKTMCLVPWENRPTTLKYEEQGRNQTMQSSWKKHLPDLCCQAASQAVNIDQKLNLD